MLDSLGGDWAGKIGEELSPEQIGYLTTALTDFETQKANAETFISETETFTGSTWAELASSPEGENYTKELSNKFNTGLSSYNQFLESLNREASFIPPEVETEITATGEGIQYADEYKDQPYYKIMMDTGFDLWKAGDVQGLLLD